MLIITKQQATWWESLGFQNEDKKCQKDREGEGKKKVPEGLCARPKWQSHRAILLVSSGYLCMRPKALSQFLSPLVALCLSLPPPALFAGLPRHGRPQPTIDSWQIL